MRKCAINRIVSLSLVGIGGFLLGGAAGLALGNLSNADRDGDYLDYDINLSNADIDGDYLDSMSEQGYKRRVRELYSDASNSAKELLEESYSYEDDIEDDVEIIEHRKMTLINQDGDEVEMVNTTEGLIEVKDPYIISEDEYMYPTSFVEFERNTLIYYEGDDTLTTDRDEVIITDIEEIVGSSALTSFGTMSGNKDVVYVRNVRIGADFEILRESGSYQELVLGLSDEDVEYEKAKKFFENMQDDGR